MTGQTKSMLKTMCGSITFLLLWNAAWALGESKDTRAVEPLITALKDKNEDVRRNAADVLVKIGPRAVEPLIAALKDADENVREHAAKALGEIKDPRAVEPLITALKDENKEVRRHAAQALGESKDTRAVEPLIAALKDENGDVRRHAAEALEDIGPRAVELLIVALKDENKEVRRHAAQALGEIKDPRAIEPLAAALKDENEDVRMRAALALSAFKDPRAVEPLIAALKDTDGRVLWYAVRALGEIKDPRAVKPLIAVLKNAYRVVESARSAWRPNLTNELENLNRVVERDAAEALVKIGTMAVEPLLENLTDWNFNESVTKVLFSLGWKPESAKDKIHLLVAQRDGTRLRESWEVTQKILLKDIETNVYCTIENALYAFIGIGKREIIPVLIEKLNVKGSKTMAEAYLNCGNDELNNAAREWASKNGYHISTGSGAAPVGWGGMR
ncbi:MAG TPA: HEAT repeat domain-containing protein [Candidatus Wunengus sp. YC60]|uniref:HEAT repeat domain-containing protein n=1 Tax=Candidatus Wunengus sp. YC60 TaxID=3367697 RepID=UPI004025CE83